MDFYISSLVYSSVCKSTHRWWPSESCYRPGLAVRNTTQVNVSVMLQEIPLGSAVTYLRGEMLSLSPNPLEDNTFSGIESANGAGWGALLFAMCL